MIIRLGVISPKKSIEHIEKIQKILEDKCEIIYLPYNELSDIKDIYLANHMFLDGIIFSGPLSYYILTNEVDTINTPCYYLDISQRDFYKLLFKILLENRDLDFSRVAIDFVCEDNNFLALKDIFSKENFPYILYPEINYDLYDVAFEKHLSLWKEGKIDLSITRISNIIDKLNENNVKNIFVFPSKESIINTFENAIREIKLIRLKNNQVAVGNITNSNLDLSTQNINNESELKQMMLHKSLIEYGNKHNIPFTIQKNNLGFELLTSNADLIEITKDFSFCSLLNYLQETLSFKVSIGWGMGNNLQQARLNAQNANNEAKNNGGNCSFAITEEERIIGPLSQKSCLEYSNARNPRIEKISEKLNMSSLNIQKIIAVMDKLNTNELSSEDIAFHLGIALRSANRILNKLQEKGAAEVSYKKQEKLRGRPKKVYKINLK